jgi:hypothetical protein
MRRKTGYMFLRPGSRNWHIKLQSPTGRIEKSLGTPDRVQAEILALPMIAEHKAALLAARPRVERRGTTNLRRACMSAPMADTSPQPNAS